MALYEAGGADPIALALSAHSLGDAVDALDLAQQQAGFLERLQDQLVDFDRAATAAQAARDTLLGRAAATNRQLDAVDRQLGILDDARRARRQRAERRAAAAQQALQAQLAAATTASNGLVGYSTATAGGTQLLATGTLLQGSTSPVGAATIDVYLAGKRSPMLGSGAFFVQSGERWGIDPRLVVAIAGAESAFGTQTCGPFNAWGWSCPGSPAAFASWGAAIETITQGLREGYVDDGLTTVARIQTRYAPSQAANDPTGLNNNWVGNVSKFLTEQGGDPNAIAMAAPAAPTTSN